MEETTMSGGSYIWKFSWEHPVLGGKVKGQRSWSWVMGASLKN
jgi:hypothetical protein